MYDGMMLTLKIRNRVDPCKLCFKFEERLFIPVNGVASFLLLVELMRLVYCSPVLA